jgi:hypothetical protein
MPETNEVNYFCDEDCKNCNCKDICEIFIIENNMLG